MPYQSASSIPICSCDAALAAIDWQGRTVYIVFDYDTKSETRQDVRRAADRLSKALQAAGATHVQRVALPPGPQGDKQGVDDYLVAHGPQALLDLINATGTMANGELVTRRLSDVEPEDVTWLWHNRFAVGKLNIVHGDPGQGKTWLVLDTCAHVTTGRAFCDGAPCEPGEVLFVTAEDGIADTIRPRLDLLGADPAKVHTPDLVRRDGKEESLDLEQHLGALRAWLQQHPAVRLVALDPLAAFLGKINSHHNNEVRAVLGQLAALAERQGVAVVAIDHLAKAAGKAMYRGIGSIAFTAAPRAVWQVLADPDDAERRLFLPVKVNIAKTDGLAFRITDKGLAWEKGPVTVSADEVAAQEQQRADRSRAPQRADAREWSLDVLKAGPTTADEVWAKAKADGLCRGTVKAAKKELGVKTKKTGGPGEPWLWSLPADGTVAP